MKQYKHSILGGTFDHLHAGHEYFISSALEQSEQVTIGLTSDEFSIKKSFAYSIEDYKIRKKNLENFLSQRNYLTHSKIIKINDPYGTSLTDQSIDTIFVTSHGLSNAKIINKKRQKLGLTKLTIYKVSLVRGPDEKIISSTRIRSGEINRIGEPNINMFRKTLILPTALRGLTKNTPKGLLVKDPEALKKIVRNLEFVITVGDESSRILLALGRQSDVSIIDYKVGRKEISKSNLTPTLSAKNAPSTINSQAVFVLKSAIAKALAGKKPFGSAQGRQVIKIDGEEDLLALPATLLAPLNSTIIYGQPNKGAIVTTVSEENKKEALMLLKKFT